jgi:hypothetical protein
MTPRWPKTSSAVTEEAGIRFALAFDEGFWFRELSSQVILSWSLIH